MLRLVSFLLTLNVLGCAASPPHPEEQAALVEPSVTDFDALPASGGVVEGKADAIVTIHSFMDPATPQFALLVEEFRRLSRENDGELRLVVRAPSSASPGGYDALVALRAAAMQGRQRETFARLWEWRKSWATGGALALVGSMADELGLDQEAFRIAIEDGSAARVVDAEAKATAERGLDGAIAFNGRAYYDILEPTPLEGAVAETRTGALALLEAGVQRGDIYARHARANDDEAPFGRPFADSDLIPIGRSPTFGNRAGAIKIVAFMDFQCPYTKRATGVLSEVLAKNPDTELVFKHMPLAFHEQARDAAAVSVAAAAQGRFWEMSEQIFVHQSRLGSERDQLDELFAELGNAVGLDVVRMFEDMKQAYAVVDADVALAEKLGVRGTPYFFVNGSLIKGAQPVEAVQAVIDKQRELAKALGVARNQTYSESVVRSFHAEPPPPEPVAPPPEPPAFAEVPIDKSDPRKGAKKPLVTIVEFAEYQCPFCQRVQPTIAQLLADNSDVRFVFKHRPLAFHQSARPAAAAAIAAGKQGKYWEMHARLFEGRLPGPAEMDAHTERLAEELGLKMAKFKADRAAATPKIDADDQLAEKVGARGTPTFFINGRRLVGAQPPASFQEAIDAERAYALEVKKEKKLSGDALYAEVMKRRVAEAEKGAAEADD